MGYNRNNNNSSKVDEHFEQWLKEESSEFKDLSKDEVFIVIVNLTLIILVLFILPLIVVLWQATKSAQFLSLGVRAPEATIQYLYNRQEYEGIKYA